MGMEDPISGVYVDVAHSKSNLDVLELLADGPRWVLIPKLLIWSLPNFA
jgi:hypothetical protein